MRLVAVLRYRWSFQSYRLAFQDLLYLLLQARLSNGLSRSEPEIQSTHQNRILRQIRHRAGPERDCYETVCSDPGTH